MDGLQRTGSGRLTEARWTVVALALALTLMLVGPPSADPARGQDRRPTASGVRTGMIPPPMRRPTSLYARPSAPTDPWRRPAAGAGIPIDDLDVGFAPPVTPPTVQIPPPRRRPQPWPSGLPARPATAAIVAAPPPPRDPPRPAPARPAELRQQLGSMLIVGFDGTSPRDPAVVRTGHYLDRGLLGGVLIGKRNVQSKDQVRRLISYFRRRSAPTVPLIAVDQEGGYVQRLGPAAGFTRIPSAEQVAALGAGAARRIYDTMARELHEVGINLNLGPVLDINIDPNNPVIARFERSYGPDPKTVAQYAAIFAQAHDRWGIATVAKHFPGHGSSRTDSHDQFVDVTGTWRGEELDPYDDPEVVRSVEGVMMAHVAHTHLTGGRATPATLSHTAIEELLRRQIGFSGVVMTDDLEMAAIRGRYRVADSAVRAVKAGNDLVIFSNTWRSDPDRPAVLVDALVGAVDRGELSTRRVEQSVRRIEALRRRLGDGG